MNWFARYWYPLNIITYRGSNFKSKEFAQFVQFFGVKIIHTASYYPQTNGLIERMHRTIKEALTAVDGADWLVRLPIVLLRNAVREVRSLQKGLQ